MNHTFILTTTILTFITASVILAVVLARQFDSADYWSIAFVAPHSTIDHSFTITNNTSTDTFSYTVTQAETADKSIDVTIVPNDVLTITPTLDNTTNPITITVTHDKQKQTLRK